MVPGASLTWALPFQPHPCRSLNNKRFPLPKPSTMPAPFDWVNFLFHVWKATPWRWPSQMMNIVGLESCKNHLHGWLFLPKGSLPLWATKVFFKLSKMRQPLNHWQLTPNGKRFFKFSFSSLKTCIKFYLLATGV